MLDPNEFERIARENTNKLFSHAAVMLRNYSDAEDAVEEAFYRLFKRKEPFESEEHCAAWLMRVTINASLKMLGRKRFFSGDCEEELEKITEQFDYPEQSEVFEAVSQLDGKYKSVILLYYYDGYSTEETAKILGISRTAVTTRLDRARKILKKNLSGRDDNEYNSFSEYCRTDIN